MLPSSESDHPAERRQDAALAAVRDDIRDIKDTLKSLANSMIKLALVEERQLQTAAAQDRLLTALSGLELRLSRLEVSAANTNRTSKLIDAAMIGVVVVVALFIAHKTGLSL